VSADVRTNGRLAAKARLTSSSGAPLPSWSGCQRLGPQDILRLDQADGSFDGRYIGIKGADDIVVPLAPLLPLGVGRSRK
jgi:type IV secretory pathway protease TraF